MIQPQRSAKVTSAALRKVEEGGLDRSRDKNWQSQAYQLVDQIGELGYLLNLKASVLSGGNLQPQKFNPETREWEETDDERALRVMSAFVSPQGGQKELLRSAALHLSIAGESYLLGQPVEEDTTLETPYFWEFLSVDELVVEGQGPAARMYRKRDGADREPLPEHAYVARLWRAHPRFSDMADSELRHCLDLMQEIVLLSQYVAAVAKSRLSAGILYVPEEMSFASEDSEDTATMVDENGDGIDEFERDLIEHLEAPVRDRTSAAGLVPLIMRGPADLAEAVRLIDVARDLDTFAKELREEALLRLARALDAPPETMQGRGLTTNHWSAYAVDIDLVSRHIVPPGELLAEFVTFSYMRPMLEEYEDVDPSEAVLFRTAYDASPITPRQDEANTARQLWELGPDLIAADALVSANGYEPASRPDEEEVRIRRAWQLLTTQPTQFYKLLKLIPGFEGLNPEDFAPAAGSAETTPGLTGGPTAGLPRVNTVPAPKKIESSPTDAMDEPAREGQQPGFTALMVQLTTAADAALERALERAGARLVSRANKSVELRDRLRSVDKRLALTLIGPTELRKLGLTANALVSDAWDDLSLRARRWISAELCRAGQDSLTADDRAALAASNLCSTLHEWVVSNLHDQFPLLGNQMRVPDHIVVNAVTPLVLDTV